MGLRNDRSGWINLGWLGWLLFSGQMTFGSINLSLFNSARSLSVLFWAVA